MVDADPEVVLMQYSLIVEREHQAVSCGLGEMELLEAEQY